MKPEDVIGILNRKVQNATVTEDQIDAAVEKYHKTHPLETDKHSLFLVLCRCKGGWRWIEQKSSRKRNNFVL